MPANSVPRFCGEKCKNYDNIKRCHASRAGLFIKTQKGAWKTFIVPRAFILLFGIIFMGANHPYDLFLRHIFHREAHSSHSVLAKAYNVHLISKSKNVLYTVDSLLGNLGNMNHPLLAGSKLNESAKIGRAHV